MINQSNKLIIVMRFVTIPVGVMVGALILCSADCEFVLRRHSHALNLFYMYVLSKRSITPQHYT